MQKTIKEHPILFSAPMVLAILDGKKTQTRRVMKPQPLIHDFCEGGKKPALEGKFVRNGMIAVGCDIANQAMRYVNCPHGNKGDRIWVRETWSSDFANHYPHDRIWYRADDDRSNDIEKRDGVRGIYSPESNEFVPFSWHPSIHMFRSASRINLEITGIRVERLQDISDDDCLAEGIESQFIPTGSDDYVDYYRNYIGPQKEEDWPWFSGDQLASYRSLWKSINGPESWDANPWVWVIEFKRCEHE